MKPTVLLALAALAAAGAIAFAVAEDDEPEPAPVQTAAATPGTARDEGLKAFNAMGCGTCHALAAAGSSSDAGPALDTTLTGKSRAYVIEAIVAPDQVAARGWEDRLGFMPSDFGERLTRRQIDALADFLLDEAGG